MPQFGTVLLVWIGNVHRQTVLEVVKPRVERLVCYEALTYVPAPWTKGLVDEWLHGPVDDHEAAIRHIEQSGIKFQAVLCYDEFGIELAAKIMEHFKLPWGIPSAIINRVRDKVTFREDCRRHGVTVPKVLVLDSVERVELQFAEAGVRCPVVFKINYGASKMGTMKAYSIDEVRAQLQRFLDDRARMARLIAVPEDSLLPFCEEYLEGDEFDADCVVERGRLVCFSLNRNRPVEETYFMEQGGIIPAPETFTRHAELAAFIQKVLSIYGDALIGCFHFEFKLDRVRGPVPLELNLRIGGAETHTMVRAATGIDLAQAALELCCGAPLTISWNLPESSPDKTVRNPTGPWRTVVSTNFVPKGAGVCRVTKLVVSPEVATDPHVVKCTWNWKVGDTLRLPPAGTQYMGWMDVWGDDEADAEARLASLIAKIEIEVEPVA
eukprot:TRINITY_DN19654_c0_g1_i1.p1 TRINITY_DN19654_c0_g1~~TRINITY_DN19654_c0_g1_i1.p1  ORF type:complete len:438 (-),score=164.28 TRINITY_DN19654_c0_g1_i1:246-1559(-)